MKCYFTSPVTNQALDILKGIREEFVCIEGQGRAIVG
jgi:hypothetical protein